MPIYAYRCKACSYEFDETQKFADKPLVICPNCKKRQLVRLIGGAALVFKGSGFYLTDYKNKSSGDSESKSSPRKESKAGPKGESKPESGGESKSEAKPEVKPEESHKKKGGRSKS